MSSTQTPKKVYAPSSHVNLSCCRLCKSVGDISHSKNLFAKNNRALLASVEELYGGSLSQNELLPRLVCRPCERRVNNFKAFKNIITETQQSFERVKRCIEVSPSAPRTLKSSKVNEPVRSSRRGLIFGPQGDKVCGAIFFNFISLIFLFQQAILLSFASELFTYISHAESLLRNFAIV